MAQGDIFSALSSMSSQGYMNIRPNAGIDAVIHNIYHDDTVALEWYDNATLIRFDWAQGAGDYASFQFHVNNDRYIRVLNSISAVRFAGYDGIQTK